MFRSFLWALVMGANLLSGAAAAETPAEARALAGNVLVVDVQRILDESLAAKSVQKQIESQRSKFQTDISKEENDLRQAETDLSKAHDKLNADIYAEREQQLRQRFLTVERHVQARRKVLDQAFSDSMNRVRGGLLDIVTDVAHQHGANLVLNKQQIVWTDKAQDVTDEVLSRLNSKLPQVPVQMAPEEKAEQPAP